MPVLARGPEEPANAAATWRPEGMDAGERRQLGAHYTSERDVMKLLRGLFLDELTARLEAALGEGTAGPLRAFMAGLRGLRIFDPACGCGDFLVVAYRELRRLEARALVALHGGGESLVGARGVRVDQMFGLEIAQEPVRVAELGLLAVEAACEQELARALGVDQVRPSGGRPRLRVANALAVEWSELLPPGDDVIVLGNPPFVGKHYQTAGQKAEMRAIFGARGNAGDLDYAACWFVLAARYLQGTRGRCAFVATNSVTQGEQVPLLWRVLFERYAVKIHFAHRTFSWAAEARVHVVIVGFGAFDRGGKRLFDEMGGDEEPVCVGEVDNISPYLTVGPDRYVVKARKVPAGVPVMRCGSKPSDGGSLIFTDAERDLFLREEPGAERFFRRYCGAEEFLNGGLRWCLWLRGVDPALLRGLPQVWARVLRVQAFRAASTAAPTRAAAGRAEEFFHVAQPEGDYLAVPEVSSERRRYIPVGYLPGDVIASNKLYVVAAADRVLFGVLSSAMHMAWVRVVCGRLKSDYQYSATLGYNPFPWPTQAGAAERAAVEAAAQGVLAARGGFPESTLAELYDPARMPGSLARAHAVLDRAVDRCYRPEPFVSEQARFGHLLALVGS
jgi:hypothetical protein